MATTRILADADHPAIQRTMKELTADAHGLLDEAERLFAFVRDEIRFGLPPVWEDVTASETLDFGVGYCNTKATLYHALCKAAGIPSRLHTGLIDKRILKGIVPPAAYPFLSHAGSHAWVELEIDGEWKPVDSYINDRPLYEAARYQLMKRHWTTGFSLSTADGPTCAEFNFGERGFVHMGAVIADHGTWDDFSDYMATDDYVRMSRMQLATYPLLARWTNRRCNRLRKHA